MTRTAFLLALFFSMLSPALASERTVTVFAAASLRGALEDIAERFDAEVRLSFGGSGTIARQIAAGAPADVVVLANTLWMDWLSGQDALSSADVRPVTQNTLVLIGPAGMPAMASLQELPDRLGQDRLAMGQRDAVPAGSYARQWMQGAGLWDQINPKLAETDNVRAALALVARGDVPLGIVYATDAQAEPAVDILWTAEKDMHDVVQYPAAAVTPRGDALVAFLTSPTAADIFKFHGFAPVTP